LQILYPQFESGCRLFLWRVPSTPYLVVPGSFRRLWTQYVGFFWVPLFDSEPALVEGERKVKRVLTGVVSAVPRIHLPTVRSRLLPRHLPFHLPPGRSEAPSTALRAPSRPQSALLARLAHNAYLMRQFRSEGTSWAPPTAPNGSGRP
jgi:hypothetical protein